MHVSAFIYIYIYICIYVYMYICIYIRISNFVVTKLYCSFCVNTNFYTPEHES